MTPDENASEAANLYRAPTTIGVAVRTRHEPGKAASDAITDRTIEAFRRTRGWVLLVGWAALMLAVWFFASLCFPGLILVLFGP